MSVFGTGPAAGIAQTALNAQQAARRKDRDKTTAARETRRLRELMEAHLRALEEGDEADTPTQLHIDNHLPEHHTPTADGERGSRIDRTVTDPVTERDQSTGDTPDDESDGDTLYRHLDVQA